MEASQLKINPDHLRFKPMTPGKRSALRRENIKALIRSKPAGTIITGIDFARVTQSTPESCHSMVMTMVRGGVIRKIPSELKGGQYCYEVLEDVKVTTPPAPSIVQKVVKQLPTPTADLIDKAKQFVWEEDSNSLRHFIKWLESYDRGGKL